MSSNTPIFTLPIAAYKSSSYAAPEGSFTLTQPAPQIYLLTFHSPPENRLTPQFLDTFSLALDIILTTLPPGVVITTSSVQKFYSNGLDFAAAISSPGFMTGHLYPLWRKLLTYPMPTISLINGHNFAGGLMTSMTHDYRLMNPHKGYLCLNELDFNAALTPPMSSVFKHKLPKTVFRTLALEGKRFNALAALEAGIVDSIGGVDEAVKLIGDLGLVGKLRPLGVGAYGLIKEEMYREILADIDVQSGHYAAKQLVEKRDRERRLEASRRNVEGWKRGGGKVEGGLKAKL